MKGRNSREPVAVLAAIRPMTRPWRVANQRLTTADITGFSIYNPANDGSGAYAFGMMAPTTAMPVPEPTATLFLGLAGLGALSRRRRSK